MNDFPIISTIILSPLIGAIALLLRNERTEESKKCLKFIALFSSIVTFLLCFLLYFNFDQTAAFQFQEKYTWFNNYNISYHVGVDSISMLLILLTSFLVIACVLCSWKSVECGLKGYFVSFLLLEALTIGAFSALDFILFYVLFEAVLIPMFFIIGVWGSENRIYAAYKFFLYTLVGSVFLLVAIIYIYQTTGTSNILELKEIVSQYNLNVQIWLWVAFFLSFAIKVPMWPFHTWLPDAHVQAPTAGSVILAGVLLKMGGYGFLRFSLPMLPQASAYLSEAIYILSIIAIIYTSFIAFVQTNMKKLIAYSSIAHMGYVTLGIFSLNHQGVSGAMMQMISHGLIAAALFLVIGMLSDRTHSKEIRDYGGVAKTMPILAVFFMIFTISSVALPGTSAFIGEFLTLLAMYKVNKFYSFLAASAMFLGAIYMLWLYARVMFGKIRNKKIHDLKDLNIIEIAILVPLVIVIVVVGVYPSVVLSMIEQSVESIVRVF